MQTKRGSDRSKLDEKVARDRRKAAAKAFPFDLARAYLLEHQQLFTEREYDRISGHIRARRHDLLSQLKDVQGQHSCAPLVRARRQIRAFFTKNAQFADDESCTLAAWSSFQEAERRCAVTNHRLEWDEHLPHVLPVELRYKVALFRKKFQEVLGEVDDFLNWIPVGVRLTSGASEAASRQFSQPFMKLKGYARLPRRSFPFVHALYRAYGHEPPRCFASDVNRVALVPKNWKTKRTIACEPGALLPFQLAFDDYIKIRLKEVAGIDLSTQRRNREAAYKASISGDDATIDLKGASDTVSLALVRLNCGAAWWAKALSRLRVTSYRSDFGQGVYHKFSSMGNGTTFGLETAIFWAAAYACGVDNPLVYGDDMVVPTSSADRVVEFLRYLGFETNNDKTYVDGFFRESCGGDYWYGADVTPVYLRESVLDRSTRHLIWNGMMERCCPNGPVAAFLRSSLVYLPVVVTPYDGDETSGVWISATTAWDQGLLRWGKPPKNENEPYYQTPVYSRLVTRTRSIGCSRSSRALEYWYLRAHRGRVSVARAHLPEVEDSIITSAFSGMRTSTSLERMAWTSPGPVPPHIYAWEEVLVRLTAD